ncbi:hypothetical protein NP493_246g02031 [Ridgeia piscesae]|uniref:Uncharacterized protein n=1 Tax=Ridgeia piscesae TaxID=27915 RepID=A0AAD9NZ07_RIDPI|nr:hypothetical protein NP493_246g02031 [Ridgeia piscesae]
MGMTAGPHLAAGEKADRGTQAVPAPDRVTNKGSQACTQTKRTGKRLIAKVNELKGKQFKEENFMPRQVAIPNAGCVGERSHHILMSLITKTMSSDDTTQLVNRCLTPPLLHSSGSCKPIIALGGEPTSHTCIQCSLPHVPPKTTPAPHRIMSYQASVQAQ